MIIAVIASVLLIGLDQMTKAFARFYLVPGQVFVVIPGILDFRYFENNGAAFNILSGNQLFLQIVTGAALLVLAYILLFRKPKKTLEYIALLMIFSGGVGNLIDRIIHGYVVDFINFSFMNFAVFNIADIFVTMGFVLFACSFTYNELKAGKEAKKQAKSHVLGTSTQNGDKNIDTKH